MSPWLDDKTPDRMHMSQERLQHLHLGKTRCEGLQVGSLRSIQPSAQHRRVRCDAERPIKHVSHAQGRVTFVATNFSEKSKWNTSGETNIRGPPPTWQCVINVLLDGGTRDIASLFCNAAHCVKNSIVTMSNALLIVASLLHTDAGPKPNQYGRRPQFNQYGLLTTDL